MWGEIGALASGSVAPHANESDEKEIEQLKIQSNHPPPLSLSSLLLLFVHAKCLAVNECNDPEEIAALRKKLEILTMQ